MRILCTLAVIVLPAFGQQMTGASKSNMPDFRSLIAVCLAMETGSVTPTPEPAPVPPPPPGPADSCPNCKGTGRLGDGTVSVECPACDGTGKRKTQPAPQPLAEEPEEEPAPVKKKLIDPRDTVRWHPYRPLLNRRVARIEASAEVADHCEECEQQPAAPAPVVTYSRGGS